MKKIIISIILLVIGIQIDGYCSPTKRALVIGNSDYLEIPLRNAVNDANAITQTLTELGFSVTKKVNVTQQDMEDAIKQFGKEVRPNDIVLFYYSGHGVQVDGVNYLLPIGVNIDAADEIKYKAVAADMILDKLGATGSQLNLMILDACRNNPFKRVRSLDKGLAVMSAPTGTLIAYATAPGTIAYDGDGNNSPYTKHLLKAMRTPGLKIEELLKQVRIAVMAETNHKQVPWEASSLTGDFYFLSIQKDRNILFSDTFSGSSLTSDWKWIRKGADTWNIESGKIQVTTSPWHDFWQDNNTASLLYIDEPIGNYSVEASIKGNPVQDHQQAGIVIHHDDDNYVRLTIGFIKGKMVIAWSKEYNRQFTDEKFVVIQKVDTKLRIEKRKETYTAFYYNDNLQRWEPIGESLRPSFGSEKNKVGIAALASPVPITFLFDDFTVEHLEE